MHSKRHLLLAVLFLSGPVGLFAQFSAAPRIVSAINESERTVLKGNTHPLARAAFDRGAAPDDLPMDRMLLVLKRSPQQEAALAGLLDAQQNPASPSYHKWFSPDAFGKQFGVSDADLAVVNSWLEAHGFRVTSISPGRGVIEFSGTAGQVRAAFHTAIHKFVVNGAEHWANVSDPSIPSAMTPVVAGIASLHNFHSHSMLRTTRKKIRVSASSPLFNDDAGDHFLGPGDYAVQYNINPLYQQQVTGKGVTIAVVGPTNFDAQDIDDFRDRFGLSDNPPQVIVNGIDPGDPEDGSEAEVLLDASWSGAVAPDAAVKVVVSADTNTTNGSDLSELYIVDHNLADIVTESLGLCEAYAGTAYTMYLNSVREQAAAQGITFIVSTGDSGPYGCADFDNELAASGPVSVNALASSPYAVAIGGTEFNENGNDAKYWSTTEQKISHASLIAPVPESVWNESCAGSFCFNNILAGSGGKSTIFPKPSWQTGVPGIPYDQARDLPDVSLTASSHDGYIVCMEYSCELETSGDFYFYVVSGTSASAPSFAGVMALVVQQTGSRQGQADYTLYKLAAQQQYSQCNGSVTAPLAGACVFNDITAGNNAVPGEPGYGTPSAAYEAVTGYDRATGLGTINVANLAKQWGSIGTQATSTTLSITPTTLVHGSAATVNITVAASGGDGTPTGQVSLVSSASGVGSFPLSNGSVDTTTGLLAGGTYSVQAHYAGDGAFAPSDSSPVSIVVAPEASTASVEVATLDEVGNLIPVTSGLYGDLLLYSVNVAGQSGLGGPTGTINITDNGQGLPDNPGFLNSSGTMLGLPMNAPTVGAHTVIASYGGDASFSPSTSQPYKFTIQQSPSFSTLLSRCLSTNPVTLNLEVDPGTYFGDPPSGTVTFSSGKTVLGPPAKVQFQVGDEGFFWGATLSTSSLTAGKDTITATYSGDGNYLTSSDTEPVLTAGETCIADVYDAASYLYYTAQDELISIFGGNLATTTASATSAAWPTSLGGTTVTIKDSKGQSLPTYLSYVSPGQINSVIPPGTHLGGATIEVSNKNGTDEIPIFIQAVSPALFSADASGFGLAAANLVRIAPGGKQTIEPVASVDSSGNFNPVPIVFNSDELVLVLYGTGIRQRSSLANTQVYFNNSAVVPSYAGPQNQYYGLDQVNVILPPALAGAGDVSVQVCADDLCSWPVDVVFQ